jgi:hypothetical protein
MRDQSCDAWRSVDKARLRGEDGSGGGGAEGLQTRVKGSECTLRTSSNRDEANGGRGLC